MPRWKQRKQALTSAWRANPLLFCGLLLTLCTALFPIWIARYLPLLDYPGHLANLYVWRHLHDPALRYDSYYQENLVPLPYWVQYGLEYLLAIPFGEEAAQKLFLSLAIALLPASVALFAKQLGRDPWVSVLAFPLAWNMNVSHGFLAYVGGLPLLFFALCCALRFADSPSIFRGILTTLLGVCLYFSHILIWGAFLCIGSVLSILSVSSWSLRRLICLPLPFVPVGLVGVWAQLYGNAEKTNLPVAGKGLSAYEGVYNTFSANLGMISGWTMNTIPGLRDEHLYSGILLGGYLLLLLSSLWCRNPSFDNGHRAQNPIVSMLRSLVCSRALWGFLITAILYFSLPRSLLRPFYWFAINRRLAVLLCLFALFLISGSLLRSRLRQVTLLAMMALSIVYTIDISAHFVRFNRRNHGFDELMAQVPLGKQVLPLMFAPGDRDALMNCFNQWGSYIQIRQGGFMTPYFPVEFPLKVHKRLPSPVWDAPGEFHFAYHAPGWDYVLLHGATQLPIFSGSDPRLRLVDRRGAWSLFQKEENNP